MFKLFVGVALSVLTYDRSYIIAGESRLIGLIPHFIGFFIVLLAIGDLKNQSSYFERAKMPAYVMLFYSLAIYLLKAFGILYKIQENHGIIVYMMELAETIGTLFVCYMLIMAVSNVEHKRNVNIGCVGVQRSYKVMAFVFLLYYIAYITNILMASTDMLAVTVGIVLLFNTIRSVAAAVFLVFLYRTWTKYVQCFSE